MKCCCHRGLPGEKETHRKSRVGSLKMRPFIRLGKDMSQVNGIKRLINPKFREYPGGKGQPFFKFKGVLVVEIKLC